MKKPRSIKHLQRARFLLPLATCSVVLVLFSAVVYALAVPGALTGNSSSENNTIIGSLFGSANAETSGDVSDGGQNGSVLPNDSNNGSPTSPAALSSVPSLGSAALETVNSVVGGTISQSGGTIHVVNNDGSSTTSQDQDQNQGQDQTQDQNQNSQIKPEAQTPVFDAETESGFHAQLVKSYSQINSYYEEVRKGYNNLYAEWAAGKGTEARSDPINPQSCLNKCEAKRVEAAELYYNGKRISSDSKWYSEYKKVHTLWNDLVNASSLMKEFNQNHTQQYAAERLAVYKSSTGYDSPLDEFAQNYSKVRL